MTKTYIFDFGNVLFRFDPMHMTSVYVKDPDECKLVSDIVFGRNYWDKLDSGDITDEAVKTDACLHLPEHLREVGCKVYDHWQDNVEEIAGMREIVTKLRDSGKKLYLLSDICISFSENYKTVPAIASLFSMFDGLVFSGPIHMTKATPDVFRHLLTKYDQNASDCTFIDDNPKNIANAESLGIHGYLFDGDAGKLNRYIFGD